ncbi:hypothetical protein KFE25_011698 [Diacronema lutheri]|uniref:Uncharacterized protein n=1 Tax=Diacronema lutheri TaxID=2081491 RepID=A0A8J6C0T3_DIALT|nr:hypothetical protein KFE25_011698 [Diacronema lutheri]
MSRNPFSDGSERVASSGGAGPPPLRLYRSLAELENIQPSDILLDVDPDERSPDASSEAESVASTLGVEFDGVDGINVGEMGEMTPQDQEMLAQLVDQALQTIGEVDGGMKETGAGADGGWLAAAGAGGTSTAESDARGVAIDERAAFGANGAASLAVRGHRHDLAHECASEARATGATIEPDVPLGCSPAGAPDDGDDEEARRDGSSPHDADSSSCAQPSPRDPPASPEADKGPLGGLRLEAGFTPHFPLAGVASCDALVVTKRPVSVHARLLRKDTGELASDAPSLLLGVSLLYACGLEVEELPNAGSQPAIELIDPQACGGSRAEQGEARFKLKVNVLTSMRKGSFFRLALFPADPATCAAYPALSAQTATMKTLCKAPRAGVTPPPAGRGGTRAARQSGPSALPSPTCAALALSAGKRGAPTLPPRLDAMSPAELADMVAMQDRTISSLEQRNAQLLNALREKRAELAAQVCCGLSESASVGASSSHTDSHRKRGWQLRSAATGK